VCFFCGGGDDDPLEAMSRKVMDTALVKVSWDASFQARRKSHVNLAVNRDLSDTKPAASSEFEG
jgi:hypothetical protein